jgi:hypothetical protein
MKTNNTTLSEQFQVYTATVNNSRFIQRRSTIPSLYSNGQQFQVYTATVNNSTNINTLNRLSPKVKVINADASLIHHH